MSLLQEISGYKDSDKLVAPRACDPTLPNASGNGVMYTAEYYLLCMKNGEWSPDLAAEASDVFKACFAQPGLLTRGPHQTDQEAPDDYYGFLSFCQITGAHAWAEDIIKYGVSHLGDFDNVNPGKWTLTAWLWRQPQLMAAAYAAARNQPLWVRPLNLVAAVSILISCRNTPTGDTDSRRLAWHLIQAMSPVSWFCRQAAKVWIKRLYKDYGSDGMKAVAAIYYAPGHPFAKYWTTE